MSIHLFLSPHFDDCALSCGGLIAERARAGERSLILTLFAGDPPEEGTSDFAREQATSRDLGEEYVSVRRAEDLAATAALGAEALHWPYQDCIYRYHPQTGETLYNSDPEIFGDVAPTERMALAGELTVRLQALCDELHPAALYAPIGVGHHVDHQLTAWAARRLSLYGASLRFYEDYPYVATPGMLDSVLGKGGRWLAEIERLSPAALQAKIDAIACYQSQLRTLFRRKSAMPDHVRAYAEGLGGGSPAERYWRPAPPRECRS